MSIKRNFLSIACAIALMIVAMVVSEFTGLDKLFSGWIGAVIWTCVHDYIREA